MSDRVGDWHKYLMPFVARLTIGPRKVNLRNHLIIYDPLTVDTEGGIDIRDKELLQMIILTVCSERTRE